MTTAPLNIERVREEVTRWIGSRPIPFAEYLSLFEGREETADLVDGVAVERSIVQLEHEKLLKWLYHLLDIYAEERDLGIVLGSRTAVRISAFRGRLPDLLFVRRERIGIVEEKAVYGAPDLVIEIVSPGDRPSDIMALELDYREIGVGEILFVDQPKQRIRRLLMREDGYQELELTAGTLAFGALPGFAVEVEWLFAASRPAVRPLLTALLAQEGQ